MAEEGRFALPSGGGEEEDAGEVAAAPALDPSAASLAMLQAAGDAGLAARAADYFVQQAKFVATQMEHLHQQRAVQLSLLRIKRFSEALRVVSQLAFVVSLSIVAFYLVVLLHDALTSRAVIVEPFDTPPELAARGLTGVVVAGALLDHLVQLRAAARSTATSRELANSWTEDIKMEVPETGISLGEIDRLLKARLAHDTHIRGDVVEGDNGALVLTLRGDAMLPRAFSGTLAHRDVLIAQAAEYVYGETQPALFAAYLGRMGRNAEAIAFSKTAVLTAAPEARPYIFNAWASALMSSGGSLPDGLALEQAAIALKPDYWIAYGNAMVAAHNLGHEEQAWQIGARMLRDAGGRPGLAPEEAYNSWDNLTWNLLAWRASTLADAESHAGIGSAALADNPEIAAIDADLHDFTDARFRLQGADPGDAYAAAIGHYVRGRAAEDAGDTATSVRELEAYGAASAEPAINGGDLSYHCIVGRAEAAAGHAAAAAASLQAGGSFVDCARYRAGLLERAGDWAGAQRGYAAAVALAPDLPAAYLSWGEALARHHDLAGAIAKFAEAHRRGPGWADPLKSWGDALVGQGKQSEAAVKYRAARKLAPAWRWVPE